MRRILALIVLPVLLLGLFACTGISGLNASGYISTVADSARETGAELEMFELARSGRSAEALELLRSGENFSADEEETLSELRAIAAFSSTELPAPEDGERKVVEVSSSRQLISALESNTEIHLAEGVYDLSGIGVALFLDNVALIGSEGAQITSSYGEESVFYFAECSNITLYNISFGYDLPASEISSESTLTFEGGSGIRVIGCEIGGHTGVYSTAEDIEFTGTTFADCGGSAVLLQHSRAAFSDCLFVGGGCADASQALISMQSSTASLDRCGYLGNACTAKFRAWDWDATNSSVFTEEDCVEAGNMWQ